MKLYRNSSQLAHRHIAECTVKPTGYQCPQHGPRITLPLGYSGPLTNFYGKLTPQEARDLAAQLLVEANRAEGKTVVI